MNKTMSDGYKLARKFMNAKNIFNVVKNLKKVGYSCEVKDTEENINYKNFGYDKHIVVKYVGNDNKSILPLYVYFKDRKAYQENDFNHDIQVSYSY
jgi:hypothetical protein